MTNTFENIILNLQNFWKEQGCAILQPHDINMGAATLAFHTVLGVVQKKEYNMCHVQYCRRQTDGRFAQNSNRLSGFHQMQVVLRPIPKQIQELTTQSLEAIGLGTSTGEVKFLEDDWKNPSIGASGIGYEVWYNGMEVVQFTYMQKIGGLEIEPVCELAYGLERLAMYIQKKDNIFDINWNEKMQYKDIYSIQNEIDLCYYYQTFSGDNTKIKNDFEENLKIAKTLTEQEKLMPAFEMCLTASNILNIIDARGLLSQNARAKKILQIREIVKEIVILAKKNANNN